MIFKRILIALCLSFAVASGLTLALGRHLQAQAPKTHDLLYIGPARAIAAGELIKPADLATIAWPERLQLATAFTRKDELVGRTALVAMEKGQPVLSSYLSAPGAGPGLAARIPNGMRAIAMRSDDVVGVGGFLNPGSHVDVLVTSRLGNENEPSTVTALQNAEVIATGQRAQPDPAGKPESVTVVTLLLTPDDAERAVLASTQGSVHFVLRNSGDAGVAKMNPVQLATLYGLSAPAPKLPSTGEKKPAPKSPARPDAGIETILDDNTQTARGSR